MESTLYPALQKREITLTSASEMATEIFALLQDGKADALKVVEELGFMAKVYENLRELPGFTAFMRDIITTQISEQTAEADGMQAPPDEKAVATTGRPVGGASFALQTTGVKYDYRSSGDPAWIYYEDTIKDYKEKQKAREKSLKSLDAPVTMEFKMPDGTDVIKKVHPPTKSGTDSFKMQIPK